MAVTSQMLPLSTEAPQFDLSCANPDVDLDGKTTRNLSDYNESNVLVVVFTCNHCPFAVHVEDVLVDLANSYKSRGVQFLAICSNDAERYPADSFEMMKKRAKDKSFPFPYLLDESQDVARAYQAACTPDTYVFDADRRLRYRGRIDDTRPGGEDASGADLDRAIQDLLTGKNPTANQFPSVGCGIKWRP